MLPEPMEVCSDNQTEHPLLQFEACLLDFKSVRNVVSHNQ